MKDRYPLNSDETQGVIEAHNILVSYFPEPDEVEDDGDLELVEIEDRELTEEEEEEASKAFAEWWRQGNAFEELRSAFRNMTPRELALAAQEALRRIREGQPGDE